MNETGILSHNDKLIYMANQIAAAFGADGEDAAVAATADHIQKFWTPQMRRELKALAEANPAALKPALRKAVPLVKVPAA